MKQCPVCDAELISSACAECGFDPSCSFETHPTLAPLSAPRDAISRLQVQLQAAQGSLFLCPGCGGKTFWINFEEGQIQCTACRAFHPIRAHPSSNAEAEEIPAEPLFPIPDLTPNLVAMGQNHTVILRNDDTVRAVGNNIYGRCNTEDWTQITAICAGYSHTVGLHSDGTVCAVGGNHYGECNTQDWNNIIAVAAGKTFTVGLHADGTVVSTGLKKAVRQELENWTMIAQIFALENHIVAIRRDGTLVAAGYNEYGQCDVEGISIFDTTN